MVSSLNRYQPQALGLLRIMSGLLFLEHGTQKLLSFPPGKMAGAAWTGSLPGYAGFIEFAAGLLITIGLLTRPAAFFASGTMAVAYFLVHTPKGMFPVNNMGEPPVLFCFVFLYLAVAGPGAWSVDRR